MGVIDVVIPYAPRVLQRELHNKADAHRFGAIVCHRRFGKTVFAVNHLVKGALTCPLPRPRFYHIFPTYRQGKAVGWDYAKFYTEPIPGRSVNESELRVDMPNGGRYQIVGADNPDSLRGLYADGAVKDEFGLMPPRTFSEVVRPMLSDRNGWALFLGTPNGKNQFYDITQEAKTREAAGDSDWFFAEYKASQTGILKPEELASARQQMTQDEYEQEYECSFEASVKGAVFAREVQEARESGRITRVPYDPALLVDTSWDLGIGDSTAIWFSQTLYSGETRLIDYYESSGVGLQHYAGVLNQKRYAYGTHWGPHDIAVKELGTGLSRLEAARALGIHFQIAPMLALEDGINAARMLLPKCWIDADQCRHGLEALQHYRWDYNTRIHEYKPVPVHDWASHGADAFRTLAVKHLVPRKPSNRDALRKAQRDRDPDDARYRPSWSSRRRGGY
jgi:phage terminase large subunit